MQGRDIALLELSTPSLLTPVPLPNSPNAPFAPVLALGWGGDGQILQQIFLDIKSDKECRSFYPDLGPNIVCAFNGQGDTCAGRTFICFTIMVSAQSMSNTLKSFLVVDAGDSGGPIILPDSPDRSVSAGTPRLDTLVGLTSFGDSDCASFDKPAGYTMIAPYMEWMFRVMRVSTSE